MYTKLIAFKRSVVNQHVFRMNKYKVEMNNTQQKVTQAYADLKEVNYNNETSFIETQNEILYLRELISSLKKEMKFFENYVNHESKTILKLNIELEKFVYLQQQEDSKKRKIQEERDEEDMLEFLNLTRKK